MGLFRKKKEKVNEYPKEFADLYFVTGLNVRPGTECKVVIDEENMTIITEKNEYVLKVDNIRKCDYNIDTKIAHTIEDGSVWKGMVGEALFGLPGAISGSLPTTKEQRLVTVFVTIVYQGRADYEKITLAGLPNTSGSAKMADELRPRIKEIPIEIQRNRIEL